MDSRSPVFCRSALSTSKNLPCNFLRSLQSLSVRKCTLNIDFIKRDRKTNMYVCFAITLRYLEADQANLTLIRGFSFNEQRFNRSI